MGWVRRDGEPREGEAVDDDDRRHKEGDKDKGDADDDDDMTDVDSTEGVTARGVELGSAPPSALEGDKGSCGIGFSLSLVVSWFGSFSSFSFADCLCGGSWMGHN